ncbi:HTH-type transcriptional activator RhaR [Arenibacter antarcticus]|uniref:Helix-turn-helix domain-containing protein n=1 Tax=Arenibacter antarcticus TaxID=2040469 RepID=A0ABW5VE41_9FLAO|nr:response regulator transcription factor [Arenibacter sp. H213]MCM4167678.1 hypothetical protein [Arenibacter sp. H213]
MHTLSKITLLLTIFLCSAFIRAPQSQMDSINASEMIYKNKYLFQIPPAFTLKSELRLKMKDTTNALLNYGRSIEAAKEIKAFDLNKHNSPLLSDLYSSKHQQPKADEYSALNKTMSDSRFTKETEQKILLLETKKNIKEIIQEKKILELKNEAQNDKLNSIIIVLVLLFIISNLAVYSYLKVRHKNNLLIMRTIELAKVQLIMQKHISSYPKTENNRNTNGTDPNLHKTQTLIDEDVKDIIMTKLEKLEKETFFIDPNCSLHLLSEQLKTNPKYLSQVINQEKKLNFNNYINELRINHLLPKLLKDEEYRNSKLSYIAVSLGYNNLNTFNAAFKKRMGILPSKFINELNNSLQLKENHR